MILGAQTNKGMFDNLSVSKSTDGSGTKFDGGKVRYDLLDPYALEGMAQVLTFGANKYGDRNWEKGIKWSRVFGALLRHAWAMWRGEDYDPETGLPHIDHCAVNVMFLQRYFWTHRIGWDDRPNQAQLTIGGSTAPNAGEGLQDASPLVAASPMWPSYQSPPAPSVFQGGVSSGPVSKEGTLTEATWCSSCGEYHT